MKNNFIDFKRMTFANLQLWQQWSQKPHVKNVWFVEGYESTSYIHQKIAGNGYDYPFIIYLNDIAIGYIVCCDLYAYRTRCPHPKGLFTQEEAGTFCMDLFIGEEKYLNKGYGVLIVREFVKKMLEQFHPKKILIDPAITNIRAIKCYQKAGFKIIAQKFDGVTDCYVMEFL